MSRKGLKKVIVLSTALAAVIGVNVYAANCAVHTVQSGDTLWEISRNYQVDLEDVIRYNPQIEDPNLIYPDDKVYVPITVVDIDPNENNTGNTTDNTNDNNTNEIPGDDGNSGQITDPGSTNNGQTDEGTTGNDGGSNNGSTGNGGGTNNGSTGSQNVEGLSDLEAQVLELVNQERAQQGLPSLTINLEVTEVARVKSKDMIDSRYFSHTSPTYGSPSQMLTTFGISYRASGENIAYGQQSAEEVMNAWMNSAGHRANILSSNYTQIGIGCVAMNNGTLYWTQMFIS